MSGNEQQTNIEAQRAASPANPDEGVILRIRRVTCPGSFDPLTNGHVDIIERAAAVFDEVIVAVTVNPSKKTMFSLAERLALIEASVVHLTNVRATSVSGLLVDFCRANGIKSICKGLRVATDFDYEIQMAQMNQKIANIETLFLAANPDHSYLSSSLIKEVAAYGGDVHDMIPEPAYTALMKRLTTSEEQSK
ncbi:MAG: pantetheine-phosphate adenylyltransferase [Antricoccus sp.]